jgi:hypothetical protein
MKWANTKVISNIFYKNLDAEKYLFALKEILTLEQQS